MGHVIYLWNFGTTPFDLSFCVCAPVDQSTYQIWSF